MTLTAPVLRSSGTPEPSPAAARPGPPAPEPSPGLTTRTRHADEVHGGGGWSSPPEATNPAHDRAGRQPTPSHGDMRSDTGSAGACRRWDCRQRLPLAAPRGATDRSDAGAERPGHLYRRPARP